MSTAFTPLAFIESDAETTSLEVFYRDPSTSTGAHLSHVEEADLQAYGVFVVIGNDRYLIPWSSVVYVHQSGATS